MMRTPADYALTILSMTLVIALARFLFETASAIQPHYPAQAAQLVALGWALIAIGVITSVGSNWIRARERAKAERAGRQDEVQNAIRAIRRAPGD